MKLKSLRTLYTHIVYAYVPRLRRALCKYGILFGTIHKNVLSFELRASTERSVGRTDGLLLPSHPRNLRQPEQSAAPLVSPYLLARRVSTADTDPSASELVNLSCAALDILFLNLTPTCGRVLTGAAACLF